MTAGMIDWLLLGTGFCAGFSVAWNIWFFAPYLASRRRDRELAHRMRHRIPHNPDLLARAAVEYAEEQVRVLLNDGEACGNGS